MNHKGTKTLREPISEPVNEVAKQIVDAAFAVHSQLGPGLLESVYYRVGLLINFNVPLIKDGIQRLVL